MKETNKQTENKKAPILYLVVPCFNEEEVIEKSAGIMLEKLKSLEKQKIISKDSKVLFVNDGSADATKQILESLVEKNKEFGVLNFTTNYGHQNAIYAGMVTAKDYADAVVTIDADLQQDINALDRFIEAYMRGNDVVYGVRNDRNTDGAFKKFTATMYYRFMHLLGCKIISNSADYRLLSKKALNILSQYKESNLFLRGLIPSIGLNSDTVYFDVKEREAGSSKYTFSKMANLAIDGITSFSIVPLHLICIAGFVIVALSGILLVISIIEWAQGKNVPGYTTLLVVMLIATGLIMLSLGIIGEYIAKIYTEVKGRPRYTIDSIIWNESLKNGKKK